MRNFINIVEGASLSPHKISEVLRRAKANGFYGFGGACFSAAIAINRVLLNGQGEYVGCFNGPFLDHGRLLGHVAVRYNGVLWDADARPKSPEDIETWGVLDFDDSDHAEWADADGIEWDEETARAAEFVEFDDEDELIQYADAALVSTLEDILKRCMVR